MYYKFSSINCQGKIYNKNCKLITVYLNIRNNTNIIAASNNTEPPIMSALLLRNPFLLHAKVGGHLAKTKYKIDDEDIINAILYHTTGRPGMSLLEKIVYIADYIEPGREHAPNLDEVRRLSFRDLDEALLQILEDILVHLKESKKEIDPMTQRTYEFYKRKQSEE